MTYTTYILDLVPDVTVKLAEYVPGVANEV
jgi:hypothetical protein